MRRFSAGLRVVTALMCSMLLISSKPAIDLDAGLTMLVYIAWAGVLMWSTLASVRSCRAWPPTGWTWPGPAP
ncbi:hypothetical protein FUT87_26680 [Mitsuaria sp. TWR114]|uniref:hypothetical protein n=1 Tax=Mitsuaria sp. TWR114 TaxID=2601731 RepID=UPI0011BE508E|nr:hypothetical protein [Mitsuaria sp. TWR114]TXD67737.1 hypothetical protein FUT87_26680 [Mitsuaria sp. TWR114]